MKKTSFTLSILCFLALPLMLFAQKKVFVIEVEGMIDNGITKYIDRGIQQAIQEQVLGVILHIDTFGGLVAAADEIRKDLLDASIPTIAFIDKNAASAGALISLACDSIFMAPGASIGAATVVEGASGDKASEKMQSYMRGLMRSTAEAKNRNARFAEAMVDESIVIEGLVSAEKLLTLSTSEAVKHNIADGEARSLEHVMSIMGWEDADMVVLSEKWEESVLRFLSNPIVSSILMLMMMGGLYFELQSPGFGFAGSIAAVGATLFFAPLYITGLAQSWEIVLFVIGVILIFAEVFFIPGFGLAGVSGITLVIFSLGAALIGNVGLQFPELQQISTAISTLAITLILGIALMASAARYLPENSHFSKLVLTTTTDSTLGYVSATRQEDILGKQGIAITPLRPSGVVLVEDRKINVVSDGEYIDKGETVTVVASSGSRVTVSKSA